MGVMTIDLDINVEMISFSKLLRNHFFIKEIMQGNLYAKELIFRLEVSFHYSQQGLHDVQNMYSDMDQLQNTVFVTNENSFTDSFP